MKVDVYIEGERIDLFQDESISITQGVQDVRDISKIFADFSQSFTVPASDNNNRIFKHYYNADIDGGFDARTRKLATIDVNTLDFKRGKIQLESVEIKDNAPANYKLTFFGDAIKIKDLIGDDKLFDLDYLSNFDHDFSGAIVKDGLTDGLNFTVGSKTYIEGIIYPLISYTKQYKYDSDPGDTTNTDTLVNIAYDAGRTQGVDFSDLKPAIKLEAVIDAIEDKYGFNFVGGFFDSDNYKKIYMNLNNDTSTLNSGVLEVERISGSGGILDVDNPIRRYRAVITPKAGFESVPYRFKLEVNSNTLYESASDLTGTQDASGVETNPTSEFERVLTVFTEEDFEFDAEIFFYAGALEFTPFNDVLLTNISYLNQVIDLRIKILEQIYDIEVYEFLTSIFKMFNLIVTPSGEDLLVEDLQTWYSGGRIFNITEYVDTSKLTIDRGKIYSQINYEFEESEQILADQYNRNNRIYYGNLELKLYADETQTQLLDGEKLDIEVLFECPVFERIFDQDDQSQTTIQYCPYFDRELKPITGNPFLFYAQSQSISANSIGFNDESTYTELGATVFMPSKNRAIDSMGSLALTFNADLSEYTYEAMYTNIYSAYYQDYISDIFSIKRRNYKLKCILPDSLLYDLKLNDRVIIADRRYIINRITSNLVKREDTLELINDIYDAPLSGDVLSHGFRPTAKYYTSSAITDTVQHVGDSLKQALLVDTGDGTGWVTIDNDPQTPVKTLQFSLTANAGATRSAQIKQSNLNSGDDFFTIIQDGGATITVDNTSTTVDNTLITVDNG